MILTILSGLSCTFLFFGRVDIGIRFFDFHSFILAGSALMIGVSMISFAGITRVFAYNFNLLPERPSIFNLLNYFTLETGIGAGLLLITSGIITIFYAAYLSFSPGFESIGYAYSVRLVFGGSLLATTGAQIITTSFLLSILGLNPKE